MTKGIRNSSGYIGNANLVSGYGVTKTSSSLTSEISRSGLITHLDASNPLSYPGSGTVWYDLSGMGYHYNIVATAYNPSGPKYMDFNGSYGIAKSQISSTTAAPNSYTILLWTRIKNLGDWRTLYRPYENNHTVIFEYNTWNLGMYNNPNGGFISTGYSQQSLPNHNTKEWMFIHFRITNTGSPYYKMSFNDSPEIISAQSTDSRSYNNLILGNLGGWGNGTTTPSDASQYWGDIAEFQMYNRELSNDEILKNFNATRLRFGI